MEVRVTKEKIELNGASVSYYPYYFDRPWGESAEDRLVVVRKVLAQWAEALVEIREQQVMYLPYSLDDQSVKCFRVESHGEQVELRCVEVAWGGYLMDLNNLSDFISSPYKLLHESAEVFGTYNQKELIAALQNPEMIA